MKQFNVITYGFNSRQIEFYDVLPYFRRVWGEETKNSQNELKDKEKFKEWLLRSSMYMFWSRCEYECLIGPWPYNEKTLINELRKIDIHEQIKSNIDVVVDVLYDEFYKKEDR